MAFCMNPASMAAAAPPWAFTWSMTRTIFSSSSSVSASTK